MFAVEKGILVGRPNLPFGPMAAKNPRRLGPLICGDGEGIVGAATAEKVDGQGLTV